MGREQGRSLAQPGIEQPGCPARKAPETPKPPPPPLHRDGSSPDSPTGWIGTAFTSVSQPTAPTSSKAEGLHGNGASCGGTFPSWGQSQHGEAFPGEKGLLLASWSEAEKKSCVSPLRHCFLSLLSCLFPALSPCTRSGSHRARCPPSPGWRRPWEGPGGLPSQEGGLVTPPHSP